MLFQSLSLHKKEKPLLKYAIENCMKVQTVFQNHHKMVKPLTKFFGIIIRLQFINHFILIKPGAFFNVYQIKIQ